MKRLLKNLKNAVKAQFIERKEADLALQQLNRLDLGSSERDTWVANAYLERWRHDDFENSGLRRW